MSTDTSDNERRNPLTELAPPSSERMARLHSTLEDSAERAGVLDIAYTTIGSPVGTLLLAATERGLLRVAFASEGLDVVLGTLAGAVSPRILKSPRRLDAAAFEIDEYFDRRRTRFDLALDLSLSSGFRRLVQQQLPKIDYGETRSYKQMAAVVGNPGAVRAVGSACATNPLPIVVPCHRVLRTDGSLGGYVGGLDAKSALLALEAGA